MSIASSATKLLSTARERPAIETEPEVLRETTARDRARRQSYRLRQPSFVEEYESEPEAERTSGGDWVHSRV